MKLSFLQAVCIFLGMSLINAQEGTGNSRPAPPKFEVPKPPTWEDVEHPEFEAYPVQLGLELNNNAILEQFAGSQDDIWKRWHISEALRDGKPYTGEWAVEEPSVFKGFNNDLGLVLKSDNQAAAITHKLDPSFSSNSFVVQYEVKLQQQLRCGGAYLKLLPESSSDDEYTNFSNESPYLVMFGPDKCGATDKVHFILLRNGSHHHLTNPPRTRNGLLSTLYTLIVKPDQTFEIRINGEIERVGSLLDAAEFDPPLVPPEEIDDPDDKKPEDWEDEELIPDPNEPEKPANWDEEAPYLIHNPHVQKPSLWREDIPLFIQDPDASKPETWDDEEDGEWHAPEIVNPQCTDLDEEAGEGCGEWLAPLIRNPNFKGKWTQPRIINPKFKGKWEPRKIPNPEFDIETERPSQLEQPVGAIGFELLAVEGNILFDNIYIGDSVIDAENIGNATWSPKYVIETELYGKAVEAYRKEREAKAASEKDSSFNHNLGLMMKYRREFEDFKLDPLGYSMDTYNTFIDAFRANKVTAVQNFPITAVLASAAAIVLTAVAFGLFNVVLVLLTGRSVPRNPHTPKPNSTRSASSHPKLEIKVEEFKPEDTKVKGENL